jgi:site-specific DNA recombinase
MSDLKARVTRVGVYVRISRDQEGRAEGVATQEAKARTYVAEHWLDASIVVFADNDIGAANGDHRPGFEALLAAIRRGEITQVVCAEQSRLTRSPAEWEQLVITLAKAGIDEVHTYRKGVVGVAGSKLVGRILAAVDAEEVEVLRARTRDKLARLAQEGRPRGGLEFGFRSDRNERGEATLEIIPEHAEAARWAASAILEGWSLSAVAREFDKRKVSLPRGGKRWDPTAVRRVLTKGSIAGQVVHDGQVIGRASWEPILSVEVWEQVRRVLDGRAHTKRRTRRRYLLTGGIARCGRPECGAPLGAQQRQTRSGDKTSLTPYYLCLPPLRGGCSRLGIVAEPFEQHVVDALLDELDKPAFLAAFATDDHEPEREHVAGELAAVEARRGELARLVAARDMTTDEWREARAVLDADQARLSAALVSVPPPAVNVDPGIIREGWQAMTLDERRQIVNMFIEQVVINPAKPGTRRFDPSRVTIEWRTP